MRARLAELAATSARLRAGVKTAGIVDLVGKGIKAGGKAAWSVAKKHPWSTAAAVGTAGLGVAAGVGEYRKSRAGFDQNVQKQMLGQTPVPPGSE